ncbi:MAG: Fe-S cluster assembly protein SufD [Candidatus Poseidoniales archaeon]
METFVKSFKETLKLPDDGIVDLRTKAFEEFSKTGVPNSKHEYWKFSDPSVILNLDLKLSNSLEHIDEDYDLILCNGKINKNKIKGKTGSISEGIKRGDISKKFLEVKGNPFINLNSAFAIDGCYISLEKNSTNKLRILNLITNSGDIEQAVYPKLVIVTEDNSNTTIFEEFRISGKGINFVNSTMNIFMAQGANLEHIILDDYADNAYNIANVCVEQKKDSNYVSHNFSIGKKFARRDYNIELTETGANCDLNGLYFASNQEHIDHHTTIEHMKENCTSNEHYKGILDGKAVGVFNGRIHVHPDAQKTDAIQSNQNLLLSDDAIIHTKPELEIYADDVKCTHGATVGQLDENAMFYLKTRGLNQNDARRLLMRAYAGEIIEKINDDNIRKEMMEIIVKKLPKGTHD